MDTSRLKSFAQRTRVELMSQVARRLEMALAEDSAERREAPAAMKELADKIARDGDRQVIEQVAYTWFNRFTALRYMDVNGYLTPMVVTPAQDRTRPELLDQAAAGALPDHLRAPVAARVRDLLEGRAPAREPQVEAYRLLLVATCNYLGGPMPFLFEEIADYTELLMPHELLAGDGWVAEMREVMTENACQDVEIIGWLYQFYISEKKDQVFAGLKKNQKITAENIPAATQLFTPHWIVRYLVENSLGRLWLLNRPQSRLAERMDYYIAPEESETDFLKISRPEEIRICDPAAGSGHMLTYAFDLLYAIYEEEGYDATKIPALILTHNLTGVEIDDRAGALAAFALAMKAAARLGRRRFLRMEAKPDICVLQNVAFTNAELQDVAAVVGKDLFTEELRETLGQFEQAKNFGSLIVPKLRDPAETLRVVEARDFGGDLLLKEVQERVIAVLRMAEALSPKYHVVVANPPYMGGKGMNGKLDAFAKESYPDSKSDLFAMFIERSAELSRAHGFVGMITMQSWMFLSRHQKLREKVVAHLPIRSMAHLGTGAFDSIGGEVVSTTAFVLCKEGSRQYGGSFIDLRDGRSEAIKSEKLNLIAASHIPANRASSETFEAIEGQPIAHWISENFRSCFCKLDAVKDVFKPAVGLNTGDNDRFLKLWFEVGFGEIFLNSPSIEDAAAREEKWFPYNKGGGHRKWYGNQSHVINWQHDGREVKDFATYRNKGKHWSRYIQNLDKMFLECVTWSDISTSSFAARFSPAGFLFDVKGSSGVPHQADDLSPVLSLLCSSLMPQFMRCVNPTSTFQVGDLARVPYAKPSEFANLAAQDLKTVQIAKSDWDAYETSWDFTTLPMLSPDHRGETLEDSYATLRAHWQSMTDEMRALEEENNRIFIDAYGLQDELTPEVPIEEITLTCNPACRYGVRGAEADREARLLADTMREFISYAIGCMFGRYSLDASGLILANQGDTVQNYLDRIPEPSFMPDRDNVIPLFEEDWFEDDAYQRFREFLSLTFGEEKLVENLEFMRHALGKEVRTYLAKDFYADHVQRYKKRPIYWLVSSPKGAFQALIYMHRYTPDTLNITLNDYVRALRDKLEAGMRAAKALEINQDASAAEKNRAKRDIERFAKQIAEVTEWERDLLYPLAVDRIRIDLDDGVKANYPKFPGVLKPIKGLEAKDA